MGVWWIGFVGLQPALRCPGFPAMPRSNWLPCWQALQESRQENSTDAELIAESPPRFPKAAGSEARWQGKAGFGSLMVSPCHSPVDPGICVAPFISLTPLWLAAAYSFPSPHGGTRKHRIGAWKPTNGRQRPTAAQAAVGRLEGLVYRSLMRALCSRKAGEALLQQLPSPRSSATLGGSAFRKQ